MDALVIQAATALSVTQMDIYVLVGWAICSVVFLALGLARTYGAYFGLVTGLAIYLTLSALLAPNYQTPETAQFISPEIAKFFIGSSAYLIFILFILTPIS